MNHRWRYSTNSKHKMAYVGLNKYHVEIRDKFETFLDIKWHIGYLRFQIENLKMSQYSKWETMLGNAL